MNVGEKMKLLIVDDSRFVRETIKSILEESYGFLDIDDVDNGIEALDYIRINKPDIVLLDIIMPGIDGIDVLREIKNLAFKGLIHVIVISSVEDEEVLQTCFREGAMDYINKPINKIHLKARLEGVMRTLKLIYELKGTNDIISKKNMELERLNKELIETKNQVVQTEKLAGIGQLAAGIAHEINNPIGFIASNLETLQEYFNTFNHLFESRYEASIKEEDLEEINFIREDIPDLFSDNKYGLKRITEIVNSLRSFSRMDQNMDYEEFDVNQGIKDALIVAHSKYRYIAKVETNFEEDSLIKANGGQLNQVFMNLIINAADTILERYGENSDVGLIKISTANHKDRIEICFEDNGMGIDDDIKNEIFNPFFTTKPVGRGTGLGLSVSYDIIVNGHGGKFELETDMERGSRFIIVIPKE